jgi:hypothetical protein
MDQQVDYFAARGMSLNGRLWATGFWLVENNALINKCWDAWWEQTQQFGLMDQIPLPPLLEQAGLEPRAAQINIWNNPHFRWIEHEVLA